MATRKKLGARSGHDEALQRIEKARSSGAGSLDLSDLGLTSVPESLASLTNLQYLSLASNQIHVIPYHLNPYIDRN